MVKKGKKMNKWTGISYAYMTGESDNDNSFHPNIIVT